MFMLFLLVCRLLSVLGYLFHSLFLKPTTYVILSEAYQVNAFRVKKEIRPQIWFLLTIMCVYKLYLLTYFQLFIY